MKVRRVYMRRRRRSHWGAWFLFVVGFFFTVVLIKHIKHKRDQIIKCADPNVRIDCDGACIIVRGKILNPVCVIPKKKGRRR